MTLRSYMARAALVQLLVSLLSCGQARAQMLPVPQGYLSPADIQASNAAGVIIGLLVAIVLLFLGISVWIVKVRCEVNQVRKILRRVLEADL